MRGGPRDGGIGDEATDQALRALAEPRRRAILRLVAHDELPAGEIAAAFDVTRTAISQHLTVLRHAGLLTERRDGTRRLYRARPEGLAGLQKFLDDMWGQSLDLARRLVKAERGISEAAIDPAPLVPADPAPLLPADPAPLLPSGPAPLLPAEPVPLRGAL